MSTNNIYLIVSYNNPAILYEMAGLLLEKLDSGGWVTDCQNSNYKKENKHNVADKDEKYDNITDEKRRIVSL